MELDKQYLNQQMEKKKKIRWTETKSGNPGHTQHLPTNNGKETSTRQESLSNEEARSRKLHDRQPE